MYRNCQSTVDTGGPRTVRVEGDEFGEVGDLLRRKKKIYRNSFKIRQRSFFLYFTYYNVYSYRQVVYSGNPLSVSLGVLPLL